MFIRLKTVKKSNGQIYEYAHLVRGVWRRKKLCIKGGKHYFKKYNNSVHKYDSFIGRAYRFNKIRQNINLNSFLGVDFNVFANNSKIEDIYKKLIEYELISRGFNRCGSVLSYGRLFVDLDRRLVHDGENDVVLKLNDVGGYLCSLNLNELFKILNIENRYEGIELMKKLKNVGIVLNSEHFFILADCLLKINK